MVTDLRRTVAWLIAIRAVIGTILLGSALVLQITAPGSFRVDPFFFLIGLTYGLTIVYALTLRFIDRYRWLLDLQLAGDALIVSAFIYFTGGITSYFTSLYVLPVIAASTIQFRRGGLLVATLSTILYVGLVLAQYQAVPGLRADPWLNASTLALPPPSVARYTRGAERVRVLRRRAAQRLARRQPAIGGGAARRGVDRDRRPPGAQPARHRQPAERPRDRRSRAAHPHLQPRGGVDYRRGVPRRGRPADRRRAAVAGAGDGIHSGRPAREAVARATSSATGPATGAATSRSASPRRISRRLADGPGCCSRFRT